MIRTTHIWRKLGAIALALAALCVSPAFPAPGESNALEYQVKAAFLYNFCKFVEWPAEAFSRPDAPLVIAVVGTDPFGEALDEVLRGKAVGSHKIVITRLPMTPESGASLKEAHIVFVGAGEDDVIEAALNQLAGTHALAVGDKPGFTQKGGAIGFTLVGDKVRFQINLDTVRKAGLVMSSQLIKLATDVIQTPVSQP